MSMETYIPFNTKRSRMSKTAKIALQAAVAALLLGTMALPYIISERNRDKKLRDYARIEEYVVCPGDSYSKIAYKTFPEEIRNKIDSTDRRMFLEELNGITGKSRTIHPGDIVRIPVYSADTRKN